MRDRFRNPWWFALSALFLIALIVAPDAGASVPSSGVILVSDDAGEDAAEPALAAMGEDRFIVVWDDDLLRTIFGRQFAADGTALTPSFPIASPAGVASQVAVASDEEGEAVIAWPESSERVVGRRVSADLSEISDLFELATAAPSRNIRGLALDRSPSGEFVVGYHHEPYPNLPLDAFTREFGPDGAPIGPTNTLAHSSNESTIQIAATSGRDFVVTWTFRGGDLEGWIQSEGETSPVFLISELGNSKSIEARSNGDFVVAWEEPGEAFDPVFAQRYDATGGRIGEVVEVTSLEEIFTSNDILVREDGSFVVVWNDSLPIGRNLGNAITIRGREFDASGAPLGTAFQISEAIESTTFGSPKIEQVGEGYAVVWDSLGFEGFGREIHARTFVPQRDDIELSVTGSCPGTVAITIANAAPNATIGFVSGEADGTTTVPDGACTGMRFDLGAARPVPQGVTTDDNGEAFFETQIPVDRCGARIQAVELARCATSSVVVGP